MADLEALRQRVRGCDEQDDELDFVIWRTLGRPTPNVLIFTGEIGATVELVRKVLPGWWWTVGFCELTNDASVYLPGSKAYSFDAIAHASVGADFRSGEKAQRLLAADPIFDQGFHGDRVGGNVSLALIDAMLQGLIAVERLSPPETNKGGQTSAPLAQQASAVETAARILAGGIKAPKPNSEQARYLAERLADAAITLREMEAKNGRTSP